MSVLDRFEHDDLEAVRVGRFDRGLTSSCIVYRLGDTVLDTGPPNQWKYVRQFLEERDIGQVVLTHHHEDHSGNGASIQRELGKTPLVSQQGLESLLKGPAMGLAQKLIWGRPETFQAESIPDEIRASNGSKLLPVATPGHSEDMTCYLEPDRGWLFSGDLYIASRPKYFRFDESIDQQISSLDAVLKLDFETLLCSHRGVISEGRKSVQAKHDHLVEFRTRVRDQYRKGRSIRAITREMLGREDGMTYTSFYIFSKRHMVASCLEGIE